MNGNAVVTPPQLGTASGQSQTAFQWFLKRCASGLGRKTLGDLSPGFESRTIALSEFARAEARITYLSIILLT